MGTTRSQKWVFGVVAAAAITVGPGVAVALAPASGSPAALRLVRRIYAHQRTVIAVRWRRRGDQYLCPGKHHRAVLEITSRPPAPGCRRARAEWDQNLIHGRIASQVSIATAPGEPPAVGFTGPGGVWVKAGRCWVRTGPAPRRDPASITYAGEHVSIVGRRRGVVLLRGSGRGFVETDTVDARTHAVRSDVIVWTAPPVARTFDTFTDEPRPFILPVPAPRC